MILFLDDDHNNNLFCEELKEKGLPLKVFSKVDEAWEFLETTDEPLHIAIIDVMMPPGDLFTLEYTNDGLITGVRFYERLREKSKGCRVFLLTNLTSSEVAQATLGDDNAKIRIKSDFFFDEFADEVEDAYKKIVKAF
jgi:CheY-like chemotaxis protein